MFRVGNLTQFDEDIPALLGKDGVDFVRACMVVDPLRRPTCADLQRHRFVTEPQM